MPTKKGFTVIHKGGGDPDLECRVDFFEARPDLVRRRLRSCDPGPGSLRRYQGTEPHEEWEPELVRSGSKIFEAGIIPQEEGDPDLVSAGLTSSRPDRIS